MSDILKNSHAIARISTPVDPTKEAVGTGFIIENTGQTDDITFLTNAHVVAPGQKHFVELAWCKPQKIPAHVVAICYDRDLSLISVSRELWEKTVDEYVGKNTEEADFIKRAQPLTLGDAKMLNPIGTEVCCQGHPLGLEDQQYSWGKTRGVYNMPGGEQRILIQAPINHGNSGGPVFTNYEGKRHVIGVSTMKLSGEAVEGEGGIITIMEIKAILPTMMSALAPKENIGDRAQMLMQLLSQMGLNVRKVENEIPHFDHEHVSWLHKNYTEFCNKWEQLAIGGRVNGSPRSFKAWFNRHIVDTSGNFLYNGQKMFAMVLNMTKNNRYVELNDIKAQGWRQIRLNAEKQLVKLDLSKLQQHEKLPQLLHAPIFGWENLQSVQNVDYRVFYGIEDKTTQGAIVNTVLKNSLYEKGSGKEGDLIYAFSVQKMNGSDVSETVYDRVMLDKSGKFSSDGTALGTRISLSAALHHFPWKLAGEEVSYRVILNVMREGGEKANVVFTIDSPEASDLPLMKKVIPFNNETNNQYGCKINGLTLAQCNANFIEKLRLTEYLDQKEQYKFRVICLQSDKQKIYPGATLVKLNGVDTTKFQNWNEFTDECKKFEALCMSKNPPKYWTAEFARPGFKCKVINKCS